MSKVTSWEHTFRESDMTLWVHICGNPRHQIAMAVGIWAKKRYPQYHYVYAIKNPLRE